MEIEAKTLPGFQPRDCDFRSQSKCTFKSHILLVSDPSHFLPNFRLPFTPKGIQPLSPQYWAVYVNIFTFYLLHRPRGRFMRVVSVRVFLRSNAVPHFTSQGMGQMSGQIPHSQSPILTPLSVFPKAVWPTYSPPYQVSCNSFTIVLFIKHSVFGQLHRNHTYVGRVEARYAMIACRQV